LNCDKTRSIVVWVFGCAMLGFLVACVNTSTRHAFTPTAQTGSGEEYVIGPADLVRVSVWKHPDLSVEMPVRRDGKISVPLLDDVQAAGLTPTQLKAQITRGLTGNISNPSVTVAVLSTDSQTVTVIGGVTQSGPIPLRRDMGVLEAVAAAGGFTAWANKDDIVVVRWVDGRRSYYNFSYRGYMSGDPNADIFLRAGDVIVVPE
jgi:polysaccharide export outer membrane protein